MSVDILKNCAWHAIEFDYDCHGFVRMYVMYVMYVRYVVGNLILILLSGRGHVLCFTGRLRGGRRAPLVNKKIFFVFYPFGVRVNNK